MDILNAALQDARSAQFAEAEKKQVLFLGEPQNTYDSSTIQV